MTDSAPTPSLADYLRDQQHHALRVAFPILFAFYLVLTTAHGLYLSEPLRSRMMLVAGTSSAVAGGLALVRDRPFVRRHTDLLALALALLVSGNSLVHLVWSGEAVQSTNVLLTVIGASILLTGSRLFAFTLALCATGFAVAAWAHPTDPLWPHFGFAVLAAEVLAAVTFVARRAAYVARYEGDRERDRLDARREQDLTELRASHASYRALVRHSPAAMVVHRDGIVLYANLAASKLIGAGDDTVLDGTRFYDLFPEDDADRIAAWYRGAIAGELGEQTLQARLRALQGDWPMVELATSRIRWEGEHAAILVATDTRSRG